MKAYGVQPEAWRPLAQGSNNIFQTPELLKLAEKYGKSVAQITLRWNIQRGVVVIPKSTHKERMAENLDVWDFTLDQEEMDVIASLNQGHSTALDHYAAVTAERLNELKIHD